MRNEYAECGIFTREWNNPPSPFNPDFDPNAKEIARLTTKHLEDTGVYENTTLEGRIESDIWRKTYDRIKAEFKS